MADLLTIKTKIMKKYFLGFTAVVLAIAFSSYTNRKPLVEPDEQLFAYSAATYGTSEAAIEDVTHWVAVGAQSCAAEQSGTKERACKILVTDKAYFREVSGNILLNTTASGGDLVMVVPAEITNTTPQIAKVVSNDGTNSITGVTLGNISNKLIVP
jgi:hypothetical protein